MIVLVTGCQVIENQGGFIIDRKYLFHFYAQNNDGTWSHKPGDGLVSNLSFTERILTNQNINSLAKKGFYNGGIRYIRITKNTVTDTTHYSRDESFSTPHWPLNNYTYEAIMTNGDEAGDYLENAKQIQPVSQVCKIDFAKDHDCFWVPITVTGEYDIYRICPITPHHAELKKPC